MTDLSKLEQLKDWCWSVGKSRISGNMYECRIFPRNQNYNFPVIIKIAPSLDQAIELAVSSLQEQKSNNPSPKRLSLEEIRAICESYDIKYESYPESFFEGKAIYEHFMNLLDIEDGREWVE